MLLRLLLLTLITLVSVGAHDSPSYNSQQEYSEPIPSEFNGSWEKWHMKVEHDLDSFTSDSFFQIHATTDKDILNKNDILRMYGLQRDEVVGQGNGLGSHDNSEVISPELKDRVLTTVLKLIDENNDGEISIDEWRVFRNNGGEFPDFGIGPGHEFDFEEEYEKHHWLVYHANEDPEVEIMHKEDIEHELLHHFHEIEHEDGHGHDHGEGKDTIHKIHTARFELDKDKIPGLFRAL